MPPGQQLEHGVALTQLQYVLPLYMHEQLEPTQNELQTLPWLSLHWAWQVGGALPPVPPVALPDPPPEHIISEGGTGAPPTHWAEIDSGGGSVPRELHSSTRA